MTQRTGKSFLHHVGRKCPKGTKEVAGSIHLGKGIWMLKCEILKDKRCGADKEKTDE